MERRLMQEMEPGAIHILTGLPVISAQTDYVRDLQRGLRFSRYLLNAHCVARFSRPFAELARAETSWEACARCGDPDGAIKRPGVTPWRCSGQRFGCDGRVCLRCYRRLRREAERMVRLAA